MFHGDTQALNIWAFTAEGAPYVKALLNSGLTIV